MAYQNAAVDKNSREYLEQQVKGGRSTLLAVVLFSVVNLVMLVLGTGTYFLFSASVPYYLTWFGRCMDNGTLDGSGSINGEFTMVGIVVSVVILGLFFLAWLFSRKRKGWLTVSLVLFIADTVALVLISFLLLESPVGNLMDLLFHAFVVWQLFQAVYCARKLNALPSEEDEEPFLSTPELDA